MTMRGLVVTFVIPALALGVLIGCMSTREKHAESMKDARTALNRAPNTPAAAMRFADALTWNLSERNPDDREHVTKDEINFAADSLEKAAERVPEEAPLLFEREGALWMAAHDADRAEAAYRSSLKAKPGKVALWALVGIAGRRNSVEQVRALCVEGASALGDHELRDHVQTCAGAAKLTSSDAAIEWLKDEDRTRYEKYRARRAEEERQQHEVKKDTAKKYQVCSASCDENAAGCLSRCERSQPQCPEACEAQRAACNTKCTAATSQ